MKNYSYKQINSFTGRFLAAGIPVPDGLQALKKADLTVEVRDAAATKMFGYRSDTEYVLDVRITNHSYAALRISMIELLLPWERASFMWIGESERGNEKRRMVYGLPSGREFSTDVVLNPRDNKSLLLEPEGYVEGVLLGWSMDWRIPEECAHGSAVSVQLVSVDQWGRSHPATVELEVDWSAMIRVPSTRRPGKGLFSSSGDMTSEVSLSRSVCLPGDKEDGTRKKCL
jgi:hypothetical protein